MLYWVQGTIWTVNNVCAISMDVIILCCEPERIKRHRKLIGSSVYSMVHSKIATYNCAHGVCICQILVHSCYQYQWLSSRAA